MATATAAPTPMKPRRQMEEVKAPEQFQFNDQHRMLDGVLLNISKVEVKGKETTQYMVQSEGGLRFTFLATYDLERKIQEAQIGHYLIVSYEGEDREIKTQGSPLKKFRVQASKEKEPGF